MADETQTTEGGDWRKCPEPHCHHAEICTASDKCEQINKNSQTQTTDAPVWISAGIQRAMRDALRQDEGSKVTDRDAKRVILHLRRFGVEAVYTSQVEQWGEMANCCVYDETGKICPFCRCPRKEVS